jgi:hypothetical protein
MALFVSLLNEKQILLEIEISARLDHKTSSVHFLYKSLV